MKTILLADDSITIQKVVELTFSDGDYQVVCVSNGAQALKKIGEVRPDVALLDVIMPEKNGYEVCEQIKRSPSTSSIPVLLLTGTFEPFDKKRAEQAGADGHLTKPFESQQLVARVEELIASRPRVASDEQAGVMDVISGGEVYRVDPGQDKGMRPVAPTTQGLQASGAPAPSATRPPAPPETAGEQKPSSVPAPEPDPGGSYVGFADVGFGGEDGIIPDRHDESSPATLRLRREDLLAPGAGAGGRAPTFGRGPEATTAAAGSSGDEFTGAFESEFELQDEESIPTAASPRPEETEETAWSPPPEAPPAETWVGTPDAVEDAPPGGADAAAGHAADPALDGTPPVAGNGQPVGLTPEAIELIAERVVQRMSDRVIREIAWEIIPEVAEAMVRRRIKELEENPAE